MRIIITGARGFLGKYINAELSNQHQILTISRSGADYNIDLAEAIPDLPPADLVVHCAGKAHSIPKTEAEKMEFYAVNVNGTSNLLQALSSSSSLPQGFVFISTVAVYGCESGTLINEQHSLNASDPYGCSKIQAEQLIQHWCRDNDVICTIFRLPLLVGENPPGNLGAMIRGIIKGYYFNIAGGGAKKSMVLASDVAHMIPQVAQIGGIYNLTDGYHPSFSELSDLIGKQLGRTKIKNMPLWLAHLLGRIGNLIGDKSPINQKKIQKITSDLTFDDTKAKKELNWKPNSVLKVFKIK